jgi:hypothetical protein
MSTQQPSKAQSLLQRAQKARAAQSALQDQTDGGEPSSSEASSSGPGRQPHSESSPIAVQRAASALVDGGSNQVSGGMPSATPQGSSAEVVDTAPRGRSPFSQLSERSLAAQQGRRQEAASRGAAIPAARPAREARTPLEADPPWTDAERPAGSLYSTEEWAAARQGGTCIVFELRVATEGALISIDRMPTAPTRKEMRDGQLVEVSDPIPQEILDNYMDPMLASMFEDCLLLGPKAATTHPAAVSGQLVLDEPVLGAWQYRLVRPETHRAKCPWFYGVKGKMSYLRAPAPRVALDPEESDDGGGDSPRM